MNNYCPWYAYAMLAIIAIGALCLAAYILLWVVWDIMNTEKAETLYKIAITLMIVGGVGFFFLYPLIKSCKL